MAIDLRLKLPRALAPVVDRPAGKIDRCQRPCRGRARDAAQAHELERTLQEQSGASDWLWPRRLEESMRSTLSPSPGWTDC